MSEKIGIEQSLEVLTAVANLSTVIDTSLADGKISPIEWAKIGVAGFGFAKGIAKAKQLKAEFIDYDEDEKTELITRFAEKFNLRNDEAEVVIEQIFSALLVLSGAFVKTSE